MEVALHARLTALPGKRDELIDLLRGSLGLVREHEPRLLQIAIHTLPEDADTIVAYELYASVEAVQEHRAN